MQANISKNNINLYIFFESRAGIVVEDNIEVIVKSLSRYISAVFLK